MFLEIVELCSDMIALVTWEADALVDCGCVHLNHYQPII